MSMPPLPSAPPPSDPQAAPPQRPRSVDWAWQLWLAAIAINLIGDIVSFSNADAFTTATLNYFRAHHLPTDGITSAAAGGSSSTVFNIVIAVLWLLVVFRMRNGAFWARTVLTVLGIGWALWNLLELVTLPILLATGFLGVVQAGATALSVVVVVVAIVSMFQGPARAYFRRR